MKSATTVFGWSSLALLAAAMSLLVYYGVSEQYVDDEGFLIEEFWALALGMLCLVFAAVSGVVFVVLRVVLQRSQGSDKRLVGIGFKS